ncbi:MAG TPA: hypothetical protein VFV19_13340 [Candidatus Polarisedimenticolaceae bacterium]|nr:hypothetical protein [Candidatus Polarisedimenticolaceae bacterium]
MSRGERLAFAIVLALGVLLTGTAGATAYAWHRSGSVRVAVHETEDDGTDLAFTLPGILVNTAIELCPLPHDFELDPQLAGLLPALHATVDRLADLPDAVLVDVQDDAEHVRIAKSGRELVISVHSRDGRFEVALPVESLRRIVSRLESRSPRGGTAA